MPFALAVHTATTDAANGLIVVLWKCRRGLHPFRTTRIGRSSGYWPDTAVLAGTCRTLGRHVTTVRHPSHMIPFAPSS